MHTSEWSSDRTAFSETEPVNRFWHTVLENGKKAGGHFDQQRIKEEQKTRNPFRIIGPGGGI
jgi:hypothetical protein